MKRKSDTVLYSFTCLICFFLLQASMLKSQAFNLATEDENFTSFQELTQHLYHIQQSIDKNETLLKEIRENHIEQAQTIFRSNTFADISSLPILYWRIHIYSGFIGNCLDAYFGSIACAHKSGFHFIGLSPQTDVDEPFFKALPYLIPHPNPLTTTNRTEMHRVLDINCRCGKYCFGKGKVWESYIPEMRQIMKNALQNHLSQRQDGIFLQHKSLPLQHDQDYFHVDTNSYLPLIPDVAIHFRCSDNLVHGMGLLSLKTIIERIPKNAKYIYMFSESGYRLVHRELELTSPFVVKGVWEELCRAFPNAYVIAKRGMNVFSTMAILGSANITICSPSTFCFYSTMSRDKLTYFIAGDGKHMDSYTPIHPNFHYIKGENLIYSNFTKNNTASEILNTLRIGYIH